METLFDTVQGLQTAILDSTQLQSLCDQQRALTMHRTADWLRGNAEIFQHLCDATMSRELSNLAEDLDFLAEYTKS